MKIIGYKKAEELFRAEHILFWSNLSRMNSLLIILNFSLFFLTGLVAKGYYFTCYSLAGLWSVGVGFLFPIRLVKKVSYYWLFLLVECIANYFLVSSIIYWIQQSGGGIVVEKLSSF